MAVLPLVPQPGWMERTLETGINAPSLASSCDSSEVEAILKYLGGRCSVGRLTGHRGRAKTKLSQPTDIFQPMPSEAESNVCPSNESGRMTLSNIAAGWCGLALNP